MPHIIVRADHPDDVVTHTEWVSRDDFETEHFRAQLAERLAWAVDDAAVCEGQGAGGDRPGGPRP
ncbi:hypothetical protein FSW04_16485 [Baekduia soli]|uniref:Uncharacterized protein n=1 Tax=Baekduia soli TaxID=496014 RepID=A0A5B8U7M2_9ACTN|nr:hypothetical protein [Baekduia soli]QEC49010.1 hypothetical protein FSW04_16485 [Baekduia soli]